jgi:hypothetical protein
VHSPKVRINFDAIAAHIGGKVDLVPQTDALLHNGRNVGVKAVIPLFLAADFLMMRSSDVAVSW